MIDPGALDALRLAFKALEYGAALLAAGTALFLAAHGAAMGEGGRSAARRLGVIAALAGVSFVGLRFAAEALWLAGGDVALAVDPMLLGAIGGSAFGVAALVRAGGLALLAIALLSARRLPAALAALAICASFALVGHSLREPRPLLASLVALHIASAAYWIGAFAPLRGAALRRPNAEAAALAAAFGRNALVAVPALVAAGAALLVLLGGSFGAALATEWGRALALKLAFVSALLALGAANKRRLTPALARGEAGAARALRRSVEAEMALALFVVVATAVATTSAAPE
ncbi:MAG: CopD family protein [Pikeienuella sp.]|uniref:CopD family protein n=1 Tax=Pikeienuella sp. TaxID=2831957 RepID=UPI00391D649C